jgi:hypothetical protein
LLGYRTVHFPKIEDGKAPPMLALLSADKGSWHGVIRSVLLVVAILCAALLKVLSFGLKRFPIIKLDFF